MPSRFDVAVIGGGILGLATARELLRRDPARRIAVLEKEDGPARHQTGHNSGVIHSGLYYTPGSAKARLCVAGRRLMVAFCRERGVAVDVCGKLVVAADEREIPRLQGLFERGQANGLVGLRVVDEREIREIEPSVHGLRAIFVPEAGIVSFARVAGAIVEELRAADVTFQWNARVNGLRRTGATVTIRAGRETVEAAHVIACAGLHADRIAAMAGARAAPKIVPFRGDYYILHAARTSLVRGLIYPVPDARFPFLGVHFTRRIDGPVWLGPNAVLAFAREGYRRRDVDLGDLLESLGYVGFRRLAARYWRTGLAELARDFAKPLFLAALRRYMPRLSSRDLLPGPSGVRAQALDETGTLLDDFAYDWNDGVLNVRNAPSPAATSAFALASEFVDRLEEYAA
ncbi:MAG TPA: L-2-hydroxyglutarate oxidase [Candidatus Limnocylindria bacterium]|nr:L-2-hydroxyglutarate oxidase [Candidatus Limnocylindria bacterium]